MRRNLGALLLVSAILAGSTAAASAMTMSIGDPSLTAKVLASVPVTVSCSPFDPALTPFNSFAFVSIEQAVGKSIARGSGSTSSGVPGLPTLPFTCNGADQTFNVDVLADPAGPPFKNGPAVARGSASAFAGFTTSQTTSVGPTPVKIH